MNHVRNRRAPLPVVIGSLTALATALVFVFAFPLRAASPNQTNGKRLEFHNVRSDAERFIDYYSAIRLTPAQERIKAEALDSIPAPCCKKFSMKTCCCPCNLAKSAWGLSNYLIAKKGYGAPEVKSAVVGWLAFTNPKGFTGDACFTGGCKRPFAENGCGGMDATHVIVGDDVQ